MFLPRTSTICLSPKSQGRLGKIFVAFAFLLLLPGTAFAAYVPVIDIELNPQFQQYREAFDKYVALFNNLIRNNPDSLREILAGNPEVEKLYLPETERDDPDYNDPNTENGTLSRPVNGRCKVRGTVSVATSYATAGTPWYDAVQVGAIPNPPGERFDRIDVNDSASLSCLLQELVEWNKLQINLQIHNMLREYIATAQSAQLSQKLSQTISHAIQDFAKEAIARCVIDPSTGVETCTTDSAEGLQPDQYNYKLTTARARTLEQRIAAGEDVASPVGYTGTANMWSRSLAKDVAEDAIGQTQEPLDTLNLATQHTLTDPITPANGIFANQTDYDCYMHSFSTCNQHGGWATFMGLLNNDANTYLTARTSLETAQRNQIASINADTDKEYVAGGGTLPDRTCSGLPSDPNCDPRFQTIDTNSSVIASRVNNAVGVGDTFAENTQFDAVANDRSDTQSIQTLSGGFQNYQTTQLANVDPQLDQYVNEFYDGIEMGYFDLQYGTRRWAEAAMLMTYDEMAFLPDIMGPGGIANTLGNPIPDPVIIQ